MPRGDSTGPMGMGPMTGRGAGYCAGYNMPGYFNNATGRNFGMGSGRGFAGRGFCAGGLACEIAFMPQACRAEPGVAVGLCPRGSLIQNQKSRF
jgi:hypothetical protein